MITWPKSLGQRLRYRTFPRNKERRPTAWHKKGAQKGGGITLPENTVFCGFWDTLLHYEASVNDADRDRRYEAIKTFINSLNSLTTPIIIVSPDGGTKNLLQPTFQRIFQNRDFPSNLYLYGAEAVEGDEEARGLATLLAMQEAHLTITGKYLPDDNKMIFADSSPVTRSAITRKYPSMRVLQGITNNSELSNMTQILNEVNKLH